jgi:hypothetical protein
MSVIRGSLAKPKVFVQNARMVFIKTTKAKKNVYNVHWEKRTSMPKPRAVIATTVNLAAARADAKHAPLVFTKIPQANTNAATCASHRAKYPTPKARGVNCHLGVFAKQENI